MPARPVKIQIDYCAECGYDHEALDLTAALMKEFHMYLGGITIVPSGDGAYDVESTATSSTRCSATAASATASRFWPPCAASSAE